MSYPKETRFKILVERAIAATDRKVTIVSPTPNRCLVARDVARELDESLKVQESDHHVLVRVDGRTLEFRTADEREKGFFGRIFRDSAEGPESMPVQR